MKIGLAILLGLAPAVATAADPRIETRFFDAAHVVLVTGRTGIQTTIEFADDEHIENVAVGDSAAWQVTPNKRASLLFVKPITSPARTNMTVVTDRRTYLFDLRAGAAALPLYVLRFSYPKPIVPSPSAAALLAAAALAPPPAPKPPTPADLDFGWTSAGARDLLPQRVFDDGRSTWLAWGKDVALPAILIREADGIEGPANFTTKGEYLVVDGIPAQLVLRQGKQMATLTPDHAARAAPVAPLPAPATAALAPRAASAVAPTGATSPAAARTASLPQ